MKRAEEVLDGPTKPPKRLSRKTCSSSSLPLSVYVSTYLPLSTDLWALGRRRRRISSTPSLPLSVCPRHFKPTSEEAPCEAQRASTEKSGDRHEEKKERKNWFFFFLFFSWRTWGSRRDEKESKEKERQREKERKLRLGIRRKKSCRLHLCLPERSYDPPTAGATDTRQERERETQKERKIICTKNGGAKTEKKEEKKPWPV